MYNSDETFVLLSGTLTDGQSAREFHCIPDMCGWLSVGGGSADSEISWVFDSSTGSSFEGVAPATEYCA